MKKKNLFITLGLALGLGVGAAVGVGARQEAKQVKAGSGIFVYLDVGSWNSENAWFLADFHTKSGSDWQNITMVKGSQVDDYSAAVYKFEVPQVENVTFDHVSFLRQSPDYDEWIWDTTDQGGGKKHTWGATAELFVSGGFVDHKLYGRSNEQSSWYESWTPTQTNASYYEQVVTLEGATSRSMTFSTAGDPWQFKIENVQIANNEEVIIKVARNGVAEKYFGYDELESGTSSLLDERYSNRISKSSSYETVDETNSYKIKFSATAAGSYSFYAKSDGNLWSQVSADVEAETWAEDFVLHVGCAQAHNTAPAHWSEYATSWGQLTKGAKYVCVTAVASNDENATYVQQAAFIHDMCVAKKNAGDENYSSCTLFMAYNDGDNYYTRGAIEISNSIKPMSDTNIATIVIAIIVSASLLTVGGYFLIKRKHEN